MGLGEGLCLPMIYQLFSINVPLSQRSRAFGYLISVGTIGQTISALITSHVYWPLMFYSMGTMGMIWVYMWFCFFYRSNHLVDDKISRSLISDIEAPLMINDATENRKGSLHSSRLQSTHWSELIICWPLCAIYIAHFAMNWSNYIIMQWLPYYLSKYLAADKKSLSLTALPYIMNSIAGIGMCY